MKGKSKMPVERTHNGLSGNSQKALYRLPKNIQEIYDSYRINRPRINEPPAAFQHKQRQQDNAVQRLLDITTSLIEQKGSVSQPALVTRILPPLFESPMYEVRDIQRSDAELGRPLFVIADVALKDEICIGDVVVVSGDGSRIIDMDNNLARSGENATVIGIHLDQDFPYELELEGDGHIVKRVNAIRWERLQPFPAVGDRVKVMGAIIHAYAPKETSSRFKKNPWRNDLHRDDLHGVVPNMTLSLILSKVHRYFNRSKYPQRKSRSSDRDALLLYGPPGVGKTWTVTVAWSILQREYNNGTEKIVFLAAEGSSIEGSLVGSGPRALREIRSLSKKAVSEGKLPMIFINEAGALLRSREIQGQMLDGGSSLSTHEQFLAMLSGPEEIPGFMIVDLNTERQLDEATLQRFSCVGYPYVDRGTMVDQMFKKTYEKERDLFEGEWKDIRTALMRSLDTTIGTVLVGSQSVPVEVGHLSSGRMYEKVFKESLSSLDLCIYNAHEQGLEPLFSLITGPLLYHGLTYRAWSLFKCWNDSEARERLVPEIVRPEKARSISQPTPIPWHEIEMPAEYDCREILDEVLALSEDFSIEL